MVATARTRIGKITLKAGGSLALLRQPRDLDREVIERKVREVLDAHHNDFDGFAFVVWGRDNQSTCFSVGSTKIPSIMVPDFVRTRLLADRIENWAVDTTLDRLGYNPHAS